VNDWLLLAGPGVIWGASFLFIAEGLEAVGPMRVTFVRILVGFATLALFPAAWRGVKRADWMSVAVLGLGVSVRGEEVSPLSVLGGGVCVAGAWLMRRARLQP
jgi:drug/metabolite transporter (DMT)-like permease